MNKSIRIYKTFIIMLSLLVCSSFAYTQENFLEIQRGSNESFTFRMDTDDTGVLINSGNILETTDTIKILKINESFESENMVKIFKNEYFLAGAKVTRPEYINKKIYTAFGLKKNNDSNGKYVLCFFDIENNFLKCILDDTRDVQSAGAQIFASGENIFTIRETQDSFDTKIIEIFNSELEIIKSAIFPVDSEALGVYGISDMEINNSSEIFISSIDNQWDIDFNTLKQFWVDTPNTTLIKSDKDLNIVRNIQFDKAQIFDIFLGEDGFIYASGYYHPVRDSCDLSREGILMKLDENLNLIKAIKISAENFNYKSFEITLSQNRILAFYSTNGRFPVISCTFDLNLNLLDEFGSDFESPSLEIGSTDYFYIWSHMNANDNILIGKIPSDEDLSNCKSAESCLLIEDLDLVSRTQNIEFLAQENIVYDSVNLDWSIENFNPSTHDCFNEDPPIPDFNFIDTLCQGECASSSGTYNEYAQFREWTWQSPSKDSILIDSLNVNLCFNEAGNHKLSQTIWVLGCDYTFEKEIVVREAIDAIFENEILCDEAPIARLVTNRDNIEANWSDGEQGIEREILESGFYEVTLSDGFCTTIINADLDFVSNNFNTDLLLQLPDDTVLCQQDLPFEFSIPQISDETYYLQDNRIDASNVQLSEAGSYLFSATLNGCSYEKAFNFEVDPCLSSIYLPNAFSPNGDGINDTYAPLGEGFEMTSLQVYDRWGTLLHNQAEPWDGTFRSKKMQSGVYFYILEYINTLTGEIEMKKGSITLIL